MTRVAIVGGEPGGLMTARVMERTFGTACQLTARDLDDPIEGLPRERAARLIPHTRLSLG